MARMRTPPPPTEVIADAFRRQRTLHRPSGITREQLLATLAVEALEGAGYRIIRKPDLLHQRPDTTQRTGNAPDTHQEGG